LVLAIAIAAIAETITTKINDIVYKIIRLATAVNNLKVCLSMQLKLAKNIQADRTSVPCSCPTFDQLKSGPRTEYKFRHVSKLR